MFGNVGYSYSLHYIAEKKERCGIISSIKMDIDGLRLEPRFSSLASFITLRKKRTLRDYLIHKWISMDFVSNQVSHPLLPSLHCGKKRTLRDYLIHKWISMDFVSNQGSHPLLPSLHCGKKRTLRDYLIHKNGFRWTSSRTKVLIPCFLHYIAERAGFEPAVQLPVRQFSKLVVSATHPSLQGFKELAQN
jgi:uncharacterized protein with HEPN domain